jgi:hypothetical protein
MILREIRPGGEQSRRAIGADRSWVDAIDRVHGNQLHRRPGERKKPATADDQCRVSTDDLNDRFRDQLSADWMTDLVKQSGLGLPKPTSYRCDAHGRLGWKQSVRFRANRCWRSDARTMSVSIKYRLSWAYCAHALSCPPPCKHSWAPSRHFRIGKGRQPVGLDFALPGP